MIWLYIAIAVVVTAAICAIVFRYHDAKTNKTYGWDDISDSSAVLIAGGILAALIFVVGNLGSQIWVGTHEEIAWKQNVRTLVDSGKTEGHFFLGSGSIDDRPVYYYYYELRNGGYKQGWVYAENVTIVERDDVTPHQIKYTTKSDDKNWTIFTDDNSRYEFVVPNGSVVQSYVLDTSGQ